MGKHKARAMPTLVSPLDLTVQIPYHFRCPISLDLMRDPVILCTGQTYDRSSIEKWVASGNNTCPVTMQSLEDFTLIPNHTLRRLIQEWCVANSSKGIERIPTPKQPADPRMVRSAIQEASSLSSSTSARATALRTLKNLGKECERNKVILAEEGIVAVLVAILTSSSSEEHPKDPDSQLPSDDQLYEEALGVLVFFCLNDAQRITLAQPHVLARLSSLLLWGSMEVRVNAAHLIESLTASDQLYELRGVVGNTEGIIQGLVKILREHLYPRAVKVGIKSLLALCLIKANREKAVSAGAVSALIEGLVDYEKCDAEKALATIELLCRTDSGCKALCNHALTIPVLVKIILKVSGRATEYAAGALLVTCSASEGLQKEAIQAGILTQLLLLVQSDCTERAKRKAQMLLKLLRNAWPDDSSSPAFGRTDVVTF
uniref:RING-type E3 ubiquitin transferase n=1 Tax=Wollemia nobilis TaxID=56998 RepID=A0A0C9S5V7_9CONI